MNLINILQTYQKAKPEERYYSLISISRKLENDKKEIWKIKFSF